MDLLISPLFVAILFGAASLGKFQQKQFEHA